MNNEFDDFFSTATEDVKPPKKKFSLDLKNDKVLFIQIVLIAVWLVLTLLVYFFGYNLFSPFINV